MIRTQSSEVYTATVERGSTTNAVGTLRPIPSYAVVAGMTAIDVSIQPASVNIVPTDMGMLSSEAFMVTIDDEALPDGTDLREGDRLTLSASGGTYTIRSAELIEGRVWRCLAQKKKA